MTELVLDEATLAAELDEMLAWVDEPMEVWMVLNLWFNEGPDANPGVRYTFPPEILGQAETALAARYQALGLS